MKYLKLFESLHMQNLNGVTQKALVDSDLSVDEYYKLVQFAGGFGYSEVTAELPFLEDIIKTNNYNITPGNLSKLIRFCKIKKRKNDEMEQTEDYFLDLIEDKNSNIKVDFSKIDNVVIFTIEYSGDLSDLSKYMSGIDDRFKRAKSSYKIQSMSNTKRLDNGKDVVYLRVGLF